jgi:arginine/lysine/ornithine decarboxylase
MNSEATRTAAPLVSALRDYDALSRRRFHVPGHGGMAFVPEVPGLSGESYRYDLSELEGLDVLSEPSGCIADSQTQAAELFGAAHSFFLINGSSSGVLAAMLAAFRPGDRVLLPRNVHRSVISGLILAGLEPVWYAPHWLQMWGLWGPVTVPDVEAALAERGFSAADIAGMVITSPTYEGHGTDTPKLSAWTRQHGWKLVVDEAHGSLWPFSDRLPASALTSQADAVVQSLHKTAGSLTQTAILHLPEGSSLTPEQIQQALNMVQTTSPSYLLLVSLDATCAFWRTPRSRERLEQLIDRALSLHKRLFRSFRHYRIYEGIPDWKPFWDPLRFFIHNPLEPGDDWGPRLEREQGISFEATNPYGNLYLMGLGLQEEDFDYFLRTFQSEDRLALSREPETPHWRPPDCGFRLPVTAMLPREAFFAPGVRLPAAECEGRIVKETVVHCPPGVPVVLPGEIVQAEHLPWLPEALTVVA